MGLSLINSKDFNKKYGIEILPQRAIDFWYSDLNAIKNRSIINIKNFFEIGANFFQHADLTQQILNLDEKNIWCIEADPLNFNDGKRFNPNFNSFNIGIWEENKLLKFKSYNDRNFNGLNSFEVVPGAIYNKNYSELEINAIRFDKFIEDNSIKEIDFCKIDVEGCTYQVLKSFGNKLNIVKAFQLETETIKVYETAKLYKDVKELLENNEFIEINGYIEWNTQYDCLFIQKKYKKEYDFGFR